MIEANPEPFFVRPPGCGIVFGWTVPPPGDPGLAWVFSFMMRMIFQCWIGAFFVVLATQSAPAIIPVPNASFEAPDTEFADPAIHAWQKTPKPEWYDESGGNLWIQLTGVQGAGSERRLPELAGQNADEENGHATRSLKPTFATMDCEGDGSRSMALLVAKVGAASLARVRSRSSQRHRLRDVGPKNCFPQSHTPHDKSRKAELCRGPITKR